MQARCGSACVHQRAEIGLDVPVRELTACASHGTMNIRRSSLKGRLSSLARWWETHARPAWPHVKPLLAAHKRELSVLAAMVVVLAGPFILRPADRTAPRRYDRKLVILTPHHESIRQEFGSAFARYWKEKHGQVLHIDWRVFGSSEMNTLIKSDFTNAFQRHWEHDLHKPWNTDVASHFMDAKIADNDEARAAFLASTVGIGVDLMFGGGPFDFSDHARKGTLVAADARTGAGLRRVRERHPEWFGPQAIPEQLSGQVFHDKDMRWCGTTLSSFGIVFNRDVLRRLGIDRDPKSWEDLADPRLLGQVALADPTKSGSVATAFEMIIQQQMQQLEKAGIAARADIPRTQEQIERSAVEQGWMKGLSLIQRIAANARYFSDSAPKIPLEVAKGDAAAGMCIDFYGRATEESVRRPDGTSRVGFVAPEGGTAISVDSIAMLRGAPDPELAEAFMEFVLSDEGQRLWNFRAGAPGGPQNVSLRRLPIRHDLYTPENLAHMTDGQERPFEKAGMFVYHPEWTAGTLGSLRFLLRTMFIDPHQELQTAWRDIIDKKQPARALEVFGQMSTASYNHATGDLAKTLANPDKTRQVREARDTTARFRAQYEKARSFALAATP